MSRHSLRSPVAFLIAVALTACGSPVGGDGLRSSGAGTEYEPLADTDFADALVAAMEPYETVRGEGNLVGSSMTLDMRMSEDDPAFAMTMTGAQGVDIVIVDETVYMRPAGDELYEKLAPAEADLLLGEIGAMTPEGSVAKLRSGLEALEYVGVEDVDGQELHRYDVMVDKAALAEEAEVPVEQMPDVTLTFWLDENHLMQRTEVDLPGDSGDSDFVYSNWGEPVTIEPPAADEIR